MLCYSARKLINQEMDGRLPDRKVRPLAEHVDRCAKCAAFRDELDTGRRLLRATADEPSESFEWTLQLKLNRALQEAAATSTVPWEAEPSGGGALAWVRSFAVSSLAGVAVAAALAIWLLPRDGAAPTNPGLGPLVEAGETVSPVTLSAGDTDRRSLTRPRYRAGMTGADGLGRTVSGARSTSPNLLDRSGWVPTWSGADMEDLNVISSLRDQNRYLQIQIHQLQSDKARLEALLADHEINYLESDDGEENR